MIATQLVNIINKVKREASQPILNEQDIDYFQYRMDSLMQLLSKCNELFIFDQRVLELVEVAHKTILKDSCRYPSSFSSYTAPKSVYGQRARPSFKITKAQLELYLQHNFSVPKIARMISVSKSSVRRRMRKFGLTMKNCYANIDDDNLDKTIKELISRFPSSGYRRMDGLLTSNELKVPERRIRESMKRVDPEGVLIRNLQLTLIHRREYKVPGILSLWHIDGHHKLIRYSILLVSF